MNEYKPRYYETMYEYVADADISHYKCSVADKDAPDILIEAFQPMDDPDFGIDCDDEVRKDDKTYIRVCWGEDEKSYLNETALYEYCYIRYVFIKPYGICGEYVSDGRVYETDEDARDVDIPYIMHQGALRTPSDCVWDDDWNYDDEIKYRMTCGLSLAHDREGEKW